MKKNLFFPNILLVFLLTFLFSSEFVIAQTPEKRENIVKDNDVKKIEQLSEDYSIEYDKRKKQAIEKAKEEGWVVRKELNNGQVMELQGLTKEGEPLYFITYNIDAAHTISTNEVWTVGNAGLELNGNSMIVGEWDAGGVLTSHQEFTDQGDSRVTQMDDPAGTSSHATHVGGTMIAAGIDKDAKGMAPEGDLHAYDWNADDSEMIDAGIHGLLVSNHSYGYITGYYYGDSGWEWQGDTTISKEEDYRFGFYGEYAARWDSIAYELPYYLITKAAGNDKGDGPDDGDYPKDGEADNGYDCIGYRGNAKNILTVGAVGDLPSGYTGDPSDVDTVSFSSTGPADDGRIKPDICGNGVSLYSTFDADNSDYGSYSGTSMASPNVAGSLILLQEHWNETQGLYMKAATLKGLTIHTADETGSSEGPDYIFGWGLMNTQRAAEVISKRNIHTIIKQDSLSEGGTHTLKIDSTLNDSLVVTLCWNDPPGTPPDPQLDPSDTMLVNDLDLRVETSDTTYKPYKLDPQNPSDSATNGDNDVDNVEKIVVDSASAEPYTIRVNHEGTLTDGPQSFSLIVSGIYTGYPEVQTDSVYKITPTSAEADAEVTDTGSSSVTARGIVYSQSRVPTLSDSIVNSGSGIGAYSASLSNLEPDTTYYLRAFATNSDSTSYGRIIEFTTKDYPTATVEANPDCKSGSVIVKSDLSGSQTFYLYDGNQDSLDSWTGDASSHEFTDLSNGDYIGKVEKNGVVSELTDPVALENSTEDPTAPNSLEAEHDTIFEGESTRLSYNGGSGDTFEWYEGSCGETLIDSGNNIIVSPGITTTYYGRWKNYCGYSDCRSISVIVQDSSEITQLEDEEPTMDIQIYPNPTSGKVTIEGNNLMGTPVTILNLLGEKVFQHRLRTDKNEIDLGKFPEGIYLLRIGTGGDQYTKKIVVE